MKSGRTICKVFGVLLGLILYPAAFVAARSNNDGPQKYDGNWWLSASPDEQLGYLNGDLDCRVFELGADRRYVHSVDEEQKFVTAFYQKKPDSKTETVYSVIRKLWERPGPTPSKEGEVWTEAHWYFDGNWWTQSSPMERRGFVEGYLSCYSEKPSRDKVKFSKPAQRYVEELNKWFRVGEPPPIPLKIIEEKVAVVLGRLHDRAAKEAGGFGVHVVDVAEVDLGN